jgi:hypothetical protein
MADMETHLNLGALFCRGRKAREASQWHGTTSFMVFIVTYTTSLDPIPSRPVAPMHVNYSPRPSPGCSLGIPLSIDDHFETLNP